MQEHVMIHIMKQHWNMQKYLVKVEYKRAWSKLRSKLNNKHEINKKVKWDQKEMSRLGRQPNSQQEKRPNFLWLGTTHAHAWAQSKIYPIVKETKRKERYDHDSSRLSSSSSLAKPLLWQTYPNHQGSNRQNPKSQCLFAISTSCKLVSKPRHIHLYL